MMLTIVNLSGQRYLDAARTVLTEGGLEAVTMRAVAEAAGTTATAIYRHFADKRALVDALQRQVFEDFKRRILAVAEGGPPAPRDRLLAALEAYRDFGLDDPAGFSFLFLEPHGIRTSRYPEDFRQRRSSTFRLLVEAVELCMASGVLPAGDPVDAALTIDAQVLGLMMLYRSGRFGDDADGFRRFFRASLERLLPERGDAR